MHKKVSLIPEVFFDIKYTKNKSNKLGDFCKDQVTMILKEIATKLSCPFQHMVKMI